MKSISLTRPSMIVIVITIIFMCLNAFLPIRSSSLKVEATKGSFRLTITVPKYTYELKEPVNITFYIENIGNESLNLPKADFFVYDENFNQVYIWSKDKFWISIWLPPKKIDPGQVCNCTLIWYQQVEPMDERARYQKAKPGTYYITGLLRLEYPSSPIIETPAIEIVIT